MNKISKSEVQSVVFDKKTFDTVAARRWLSNHNFKPIKKVDITKNKLRYRLTSPKKYKDFRMKKVARDIQFVIGFK